MKSLERGVLIVGGGIAGCSLAIALAQRGMRVTVLEKLDAWRFHSSGIFIYSNGLAELQKLGVLPGILDSGFAIGQGRNLYYDQHGELIVETRYPSAPGTTLHLSWVSAVPKCIGCWRTACTRWVWKYALAARWLPLKTIPRMMPWWRP